MDPAEPAIGSARAGWGPAPAARRLLVVVLHYNGLEDTLACLGSLRAQACPGMSVLVIDNASRSDDRPRIAAEFPEVELLRLAKNRGWAGGNNVGLRLALERGYDRVCLLNNDTVLPPEAMAGLLAAMDAAGGACLLIPALYFFNAPDRAQIDTGPQPTSADAAARDLAERHGVVEISWTYGACLMLPVDLVRRVGLLDERFFLQLEEEDFWRRARALGARSYCAHRVRILHKESVSFGARVTAGKTYYQVRNSLLLAEKHARGPAGLLRAVREVAWMLRNQAGPAGGSMLGFLRWLCSADELARAARQGFRDYLARRFGPRPA